MNSKPNLRQWLVLFSLAAIFALLTGLAGVRHKVAHAMDCELDCMSGLPPSPEPEDTEDPGKDDGKEPPTHSGGGGTCTPTWLAPTIDASVTLDPPYPITLGQDPDDRGVDIQGITARGGANSCPNGNPAKITALRIVDVRLASSSVAWINSTLARKYPGARVKGTYPFTPQFSVTGQGTPTATLAFHLAPLDPGFYDITVEATQADGQKASLVIKVPVYLMESTIIQ